MATGVVRIRCGAVLSGATAPGNWRSPGSEILGTVGNLWRRVSTMPVAQRRRARRTPPASSADGREDCGFPSPQAAASSLNAGGSMRKTGSRCPATRRIGRKTFAVRWRACGGGRARGRAADPPGRGEHEVRGKFNWSRRPESLRIAPATALVDLTIDGSDRSC